LRTNLAQCVCVRLQGGVSHWLVGVVGLGVELHRPAPTRGAWGVGRFFNSSGEEEKRAVHGPSDTAAEGLRRLFRSREASQGEKSH
jgi:hypothetical protein